MSSKTWMRPVENKLTRVYYFTSSHWAGENIKNQRLKVSKFKDCNDSFELSSINLASKELRPKHKIWMDEVGQKIGLICFSRRWRHPLMWAHYGDKGRGACMVFDVGPESLQKVGYRSRRKSAVSSFAHPDPSDEIEFKTFSSTKFNGWRYESEERLFVELKSENVVMEKETHFLKFSERLKLIGIIAGPNPKDDLAPVAKKFSLDFFECRPAFRDFRMVSQRDTDEWGPKTP